MQDANDTPTPAGDDQSWGAPAATPAAMPADDNGGAMPAATPAWDDNSGNDTATPAATPAWDDNKEDDAGGTPDAAPAMPADMPGAGDDSAAV